jgi:hypothetical protein
MKTKFVGIILCMLLIIPFVPITSGAEDEETFSVFVSGRSLTNIDRPWSIPYFNFWHMSLFRTDPAGNWVNLSFTRNALITVIVEKEGSLTDGPITVRLGLTAPGTFLLVWWPPLSMMGIGRAKIIGVCDSIEISEIDHPYSG